MPVAAQWGLKPILRTSVIIEITYILPNLCHLPHYSYRSRDPTTQILGFDSYPFLGTRAYTHTGTSNPVWQPILKNEWLRQYEQN